MVDRVRRTRNVCSDLREFDGQTLDQLVEHFGGQASIDYDAFSRHWNVYWSRPETDEEMTARIRAEESAEVRRKKDREYRAASKARKAAPKEAAERAEFERLKAKYG